MTRILIAPTTSFSLSAVAVRRARELGSQIAQRIVLSGETWSNSELYQKDYDTYWAAAGDERAIRTDVFIQQAVIELGEAAWPHCSGECDPLAMIEVPDDVQWHVSGDASGGESVHERHRVWTTSGMYWSRGPDDFDVHIAETAGDLFKKLNIDPS